MRISTFIFCCLLINYPSVGQIRSIVKSIDEVEFSVGPSYVTLHNKSLSNRNRETKISPVIKLGGVYHLTKRTSLLINFSYERKGFKQESQVFFYDPSIDVTNCKCTLSTEPGILKTNLNLDYLVFSPQARVAIHKNVFIEAGLFVGTLVKAQIKSHRLWDGVRTTFDASINVKDVDIGQSTSVMFFKKFSERTIFFIKATNSLGLIDIDNPQQASKTHTNSFSITTGINLPLNSMKQLNNRY